MSAIEQAFQRAAQAGRTAFIPFLTGGFPDQETCLEMLAALAEAGADLIEVGLPFSDPLADGPVLQAAGKTALERGATTDRLFELIGRLRRRRDCPLAIMTYYNPVLQRGPREFALQAKQAGAEGVIIPDLPPEEAGDWLAAARGSGLEAVFLVAPTTTAERLDRVVKVSRGFIYLVALTGVTGSRLTLTPRLIAQIGQIKARSRLPVAVGFGISTPDQARALAGVADGVIVGSALVREAARHDDPAAQVEAVARLAAELRAALGPDGRRAAGRNISETGRSS